MSMNVRNAFEAFKKSKLLYRFKSQQPNRKCSFKYEKVEHQERMDGFAKARNHFRKVPRGDQLAPAYRLRPYSPRHLRMY